MMCTVVGCGDSAKHWVRYGTVIGSNDCEKFGGFVDYLVLANHPAKFKGRLATIKQCKGKVMVTSQKAWKPVFPNCIQIDRTTPFNIRILGGFIYTSQTTPIMCLSLAIKLGAKEVIMWGVDMVNHKVFSKGTKRGNYEIAVYRKFFKAMQANGIKVYLGAAGTAFDDLLPIYDNKIYS